MDNAFRGIPKVRAYHDKRCDLPLRKVRMVVGESAETTQLVSSKRDRRLDNIKLLADLPAAALRRLEKKCTWHEFHPDEVVLQRADKTLEVYFIVQGTVRVTLYEEDDREVSLADLTAGAHFGEMAAVSGQERSAWVVGNQYCLISSLSRNDFLALLQEYPRMALKLLDDFASIIRALNQRVAALSLLNPRQRIYMELLRLAAPHPKGDGTWLIENLPQHNEIASWAGTDKQEIALAIGSLARDGIVERRAGSGSLKTLLIRDHAKLRMLASM